MLISNLKRREGDGLQKWEGVEIVDRGVAQSGKWWLLRKGGLASRHRGGEIRGGVVGEGEKKRI